MLKVVVLGFIIFIVTMIAGSALFAAVFGLLELPYFLGIGGDSAGLIGFILAVGFTCGVGVLVALAGNSCFLRKV